MSDEAPDGVAVGYGRAWLRAQGVGPIIIASAILIAVGHAYYLHRLEESVVRIGLDMTAMVRAEYDREIGFEDQLRAELESMRQANDRTACLLSFGVEERAKLRGALTSPESFRAICPWMR